MNDEGFDDNQIAKTWAALAQLSNQQKLRKSLDTTIKQHLLLLAGTRRFELREDQAAELIDEMCYSKQFEAALNEPEGFFGYVTHSELANLNALENACADLVRIAEETSGGTSGRVNREGMSLLAGKEKLYPVFEETVFQADRLRDTIQRTLSERSEARTASGKRDWKMAAVAGICRRIWASFEWRANPTRYGRVPIQNALEEGYFSEANTERISRFSKHLEEFANTHEKADAPGPFGRFLEEVLALLLEKDNTATAQSALRSWREASKQKSTDKP